MQTGNLMRQWGLVAALGWCAGAPAQAGNIGDLGLPPHARCSLVTVDLNNHSEGVALEPSFGHAQGLSFWRGANMGYFVGFIQGHKALIRSPATPQNGGLVGARLAMPASRIAVTLSPGLQGTAEYTLKVYDAGKQLIGQNTMLVTQDTGDADHAGFGYATLAVQLPHRRAHAFSLESKFIRSSFSNATTLIEFGVGTVSFCK